MVTIKQALLIKEKIPEAQITVYYIDIRAKGKGFEEMYQRARNEGILFIKGIPSKIIDNEDKDKNLTLRGENILLNEAYEEVVDMVVLSVGLEAREDSKELQKRFNLSSDREGFFIEKHPKLEPVDTATTGIFLAGCAEGPKDIRESSMKKNVQLVSYVRRFAHLMPPRWTGRPRSLKRPAKAVGHVLQNAPLRLLL